MGALYRQPFQKVMFIHSYTRKNVIWYKPYYYIHQVIRVMKNISDLVDLYIIPYIQTINNHINSYGHVFKVS